MDLGVNNLVTVAYSVGYKAAVHDGGRFEDALNAYSSDRGQRFHSDGGHHSTLMADGFSHALEALPSMS